MTTWRPSPKLRLGPELASAVVTGCQRKAITCARPRAPRCTRPSSLRLQPDSLCCWQPGPASRRSSCARPHFDEPSSYRVRGIVRALQPHGCEIVLYNVDAPDIARRRWSKHHGSAPSADHLSLPPRADEGERLARAQFPIVFVDTSHPRCRVRRRRPRGGRMATDYLLSLGHERCAFIGEPERNPFGFVSSRNREAGVAGASPSPAWHSNDGSGKDAPAPPSGRGTTRAKLFAMPSRRRRSSPPPTSRRSASSRRHVSRRRRCPVTCW